MREIKFRVWAADPPKDGYKMHEWGAIRTILDMFLDDDECYVMQYTGLKDKNGVDIYEGDIVYCPGSGNMKVVFSHLSWAFEDDSSILFFNEVEWDDVDKVIGNIHENPELL